MWPMPVFCIVLRCVCGDFLMCVVVLRFCFLCVTRARECGRQKQIGRLCDAMVERRSNETGRNKDLDYTMSKIFFVFRFSAFVFCWCLAASHCNIHPLASSSSLPGREPTTPCLLLTFQVHPYRYCRVPVRSGRQPKRNWHEKILRLIPEAMPRDENDFATIRPCSTSHHPSLFCHPILIVIMASCAGVIGFVFLYPCHRFWQVRHILDILHFHTHTST